MVKARRKVGGGVEEVSQETSETGGNAYSGRFKDDPCGRLRMGNKVLVGVECQHMNLVSSFDFQAY
jgi:hypothetical protein